jgi:phasin family protein
MNNGDNIMTIPTNTFKPSAASPVTSAAQTANQATNAAKSVATSAASSLASSVVANLKAAAAASKQVAKVASKTSSASSVKKVAVVKKATSNNSAAASKKTTASKPTVASSAAFANKATSSLQGNSKTVNETISNSVKSLQQQVEKVNQTMIKNNQEFSKFFEDNLNSTLQAFNILAKSSEEISKAYFSFAQNTLENNIAAAKSLFSARNAQEAFDLQSKTAKSNIDSLINESTKLSQLSIDAANKAMQPIQNRINQTVETIIKKAA